MPMGHHGFVCVRCKQGGDLRRAYYGNSGPLNRAGAPPPSPMHGPCWEAWFEETRGRAPLFKGMRPA